MTIAELKIALEAFPDELEVWLEGCDCSNPANGVLERIEANTGMWPIAERVVIKVNDD